MPLTVALISTLLLQGVTTVEEPRNVAVSAAGACPDAAEIAGQLAPLLPEWTVTTQAWHETPTVADEPRPEGSPPGGPATLRYDEQGTLWIGDEVTATVHAEGERDCRALAQELAVAAALALDPPEPETTAPPPPEVLEPEPHLSLLAAAGVLGSLGPSGPARASGALELRFELGRFSAAVGAWMAGPGDFELEGGTVVLASYAPHLTAGMRWGSRELRGGIDLGVELEGVHASGMNFDEGLSGTAWHVGMRAGGALEWRLTGPLFVAIPVSVSYFPAPVQLASAVNDVSVTVGESPTWLLRGGVGFGVFLR